jgi:pimeloyl-ACP methyl ester carboxylesterase
MGLDKMVLFGHSLGGYLSTCYALQNPDKVEKLLLVSPVGVPPAPKENPNAAPRSGVASFIVSMFSRGFTPMSIIRSVGPFGKSNLYRPFARPNIY